jgi:tetratricopeptide (TPR) repeat protein
MSQFVDSADRKKWLLVLVLAGVTLVTYWSVTAHGFINYDDPEYVTANPHVQGGLTWSNFVWALTSSAASNWHPVTWLTHMIDAELWGLNPAGHHLTNLLLHLINVLLLFLLLFRMTNALWPCAAAAALFAVHPLNVQSVAWVAERKNVLSTLFWLLTLIAYCRYVQKPGKKRYLITAGFLILGLMSKPMLVTLPFVLLLMDYWPLGRFTADRMRCVVEKIPLLALAAASIFMTVIAQHAGGAVASMEALPLGLRLENALVSYVKYIYLMLWPVPLAIFYPHPRAALSLWPVAGAALFLLGITVLVFWKGRHFPYLVLGWLWYLGTLIPVIGILQVGDQAIADRYAYVPLIGLFIIVAWGAADWASRKAGRRRGISWAAISVVAVLAIASWHQLTYWESSLSIFQRALALTGNNYVAHHNVGVALFEAGQVDAAIDHFQTSIQISPKAETQFSLAVALEQKSRSSEAMSHYQESLRINPNYFMAHVNLGSLLYRAGQVGEATDHYLRANQIQPSPMAYFNLGVIYQESGQWEEAIHAYREALKLNPNQAGARENLDRILARTYQKIG